MLLMDFPCIEDQLVPDFFPQSHFTPALEAQPSLPDFDSLMNDLSATFGLPSESSELHMTSAPSVCPSVSPVHSMDLSQSYQSNEEITFYDESIQIKQEPIDVFNPVKPEVVLQQHIKSESQIDSESLGFEQEYQTFSHNQLAQTVGSVTQHATFPGTEAPIQEAMVEARKQMESVCNLLNISEDPHFWDAEQTQRWITFTLNNYKLPAMYAQLFRMDGTNLCMMEKVHFKAKCEEAGQYLYEELQIWKDTYSYTSTSSPLIQEESQSQTFVDLEPVHHQQQHSFLPSPPLPPHYSTITTTPSIEIQIPRPVLSPSLSPAPSIESMDSSSSCRSFHTKLSPASSIENLTRPASPKMAPLKGVTPGKHNIQLWQFLRELLMTPQHYGNCIRWLDRSKGIFKIEDSQRVARLWGQRKNRPAMNYDKLSRSVRQYYKKGIIKKTDNSKRLVYQFCQQYRI